MSNGMVEQMDGYCSAKKHQKSKNKEERQMIREVLRRKKQGDEEPDERQTTYKKYLGYYL